MLKMRQWQGTLNRMRAMQRHRDVGIEIGEQQQEHAIDQQTGTLAAQNRRNGTAQPQMGISAAGGAQQRPDSAIAAVAGVERRQSRLLAETDKEYIQASIFAFYKNEFFKRILIKLKISVLLWSGRATCRSCARKTPRTRAGPDSGGRRRQWGEGRVREVVECGGRWPTEGAPDWRLFAQHQRFAFIKYN